MGRTIFWAGGVLRALWLAVGPALCTLASFWTAQWAVRRLMSYYIRLRREEREAVGRGLSSEGEAGEAGRYVWASSWLRAEHESGLLYMGDVYVWGEAGEREEESGERRRLVYENGVSSAPDGNYGSAGGVGGGEGGHRRPSASQLEDGRPGKEEEDGRDECSICLVEFRPGERVARLPCGHVFHASCVGEWTRGYRNRCPLCNFDLDLKEYPLPK